MWDERGDMRLALAWTINMFTSLGRFAQSHIWGFFLRTLRRRLRLWLGAEMYEICPKRNRELSGGMKTSSCSCSFWQCRVREKRRNNMEALSPFYACPLTRLSITSIPDHPDREHALPGQWAVHSDTGLLYTLHSKPQLFNSDQSCVSFIWDLHIHNYKWYVSNCPDLNTSCDVDACNSVQQIISNPVCCAVGALMIWDTTV